MGKGGHMADRYRICENGGTFFVQKRCCLFFWTTDRSNWHRCFESAMHYVFRWSKQKRVTVIYGFPVGKLWG